MRKSFILLLILLVMSIVGYSIIHYRINSARDNIKIHETVLYGDKAHAHGLSADLSITLNHYLFWDTSYTIGEEPHISTSFDFTSVKKRQQSGLGTFSGIEIYNVGDGGFSFGSGVDLDKHHFKGGSALDNMAEVFKAVAKNTPPGETHEEIIRVRDYYEYYPIEINIDLPAYYKDMIRDYEVNKIACGNDCGELTQGIRDFFRIPVSSHYRVKIELTKDDAGYIVSGNIYTLDNSGAGLWSKSTVTEDACYFTVLSHHGYNYLLDTGHIPGGYGIYRLAFTHDGDYKFASADNLSMVYKLDVNTEVVDLHAMENSNKLLLLTREYGACWLTVLDANTASELQKLKVMDYPDNTDIVFHTPYYSDDFLVVQTNNRWFTVIEVGPSGEYEKVYTTNIDEVNGPYALKFSRTVMSWDKESRKLAVASHNLTKYGNDGCGFLLYVYNKSGLIYAGKYYSSLDINTSTWSDQRCRPVDNNALKISWKQGGGRF